MKRGFHIAWLSACVAFAGATAHAQSPGLPGGPGGPTVPNNPGATKEGPAEQGPSAKPATPTTRVLPTLGSRFELVEIDGNFRFRSDWFKNFHLGFNDDPTVGGAPFRRPLGCTPTAGVNKPCDDSIGTSNIRLRLEPTINITENAKVRIQIDALDNFVLGSTPEGRFLDGTPAPTNVPISGFASTQVPPEAGRNSLRDSVVVRQAYGEVTLPIGKFMFGRMPNHWGLGILANSGGYDPVHGTYDLDNDFGDVADRFLYGLIIPKTQIATFFAMDWAAEGPSADQVDIYRNRYQGQPWDLDDNDDVDQFVFGVARRDTPEMFNKIVKDGRWAINYGIWFVWREQSWDYNTSSTNSVGEAPDPAAFVPRNAVAYIPDIWFRVAKDFWEVEFEGVAVLGSIDELNDVGVNDSLSVRQYGGVLRSTFKLLDGDITTGLELGYASGDQWDNSPAGSTHIQDARSLPGAGDTTVNAFRFDQAFNIDMILFRELIGTVTNATYIRPTFSWRLSDFTLGFRSIISFANVPVATPGNDSFYGVEFNLDVGYQSNGFYAGAAYGFFIPGAAMDHPEDQAGQGGPGFGFGTNTGDASNAHTIQFRLMLKF